MVATLAIDSLIVIVRRKGNIEAFFRTFKE